MNYSSNKELPLALDVFQNKQNAHLHWNWPWFSERRPRLLCRPWARKTSKWSL